MNDCETREALVLTLLRELDKRNLSPVREYEFHQLVRQLQEGTAGFRFIDRPISFSYELQAFLEALEKRRFLDELIMMRDGWVPRHEYQLSRVGQAEAQEKTEALAESNPGLMGKIESELNQFAETYRPPADIKPFWAKHFSANDQPSTGER